MRSNISFKEYSFVTSLLSSFLFVVSKQLIRSNPKIIAEFIYFGKQLPLLVL